MKPGFLGGKLAFLVAYFETARANLRYANLAFDSNPPSRDVRRNHLPWPMANAILDDMNSIVSIDGAGRIVLPKPLRDQFNLHPGSQLEIVTGPGGLALKPVDAAQSLVCERGLWVHQGAAHVDLAAAVRQLREERTGGLSPGTRR